MEAYWLNVGSLILGLIAWGMPIIDIVQYRKRNFKRTGTFLAVSLSACAASLCMQIFYTDHLVKIEDWTALMDTSYAVAFVSLILLMVTIILNVISLALCYRGNSVKKKIVISIGSIVIFVIGLVFFLSTGGERTDVILSHYSLSEDNKVMTLHIDVAGSMGYVRGLKVKQGGANKYITFYSTYGLNNSIGAKSEFEIELNPSCEEIYFYSGDGGYRLVLKKMGEKNEWQMVGEI